MTLSAKFGAQARDTAEFLSPILRSHDLDRTFANAFKALNLSDTTKNSISQFFCVDAAGDRYDQVSISKNKNFEENAAHGFVDVLRKSVEAIQAFATLTEEHENQEMFDYIVNFRNVVKDTFENEKTLGLSAHNIELKMQMLMQENHIVKILDDMVDYMKDKHGFEESGARPLAGVEYIHRLPEDILSNG